jgi:hypothetical protein
MRLIFLTEILGEMRNAYRILVGKPEGTRRLGIPRRTWGDNIKKDLKEVGWRVWIGFIWLRIRTGGGSCKYGNEPLGSIKGGEFLE